MDRLELKEVLVRIVGVYIVPDAHDRQAAACVIEGEMMFIYFIESSRIFTASGEGIRVDFSQSIHREATFAQMKH